MEIIVFLSMLGVSLLLGMCFGILRLNEKAKSEFAFHPNRFQSSLLKINKPLLKILITLLLIALVFLSWCEAIYIAQGWFEVFCFIFLLLLGAYLVAILPYICFCPKCLEKNSFMAHGQARHNKIVHLIFCVGFVLLSIIGIVALIVMGRQLNFLLFFLVGILCVALYFLSLLIWGVIRGLFLSEYSLLNLLGKLGQKYWDWVLEH